MPACAKSTSRHRRRLVGVGDSGESAERPEDVGAVDPVPTIAASAASWDSSVRAVPRQHRLTPSLKQAATCALEGRTVARYTGWDGSELQEYASPRWASAVHAHAAEQACVSAVRALFLRTSSGRWGALPDHGSRVRKFRFWIRAVARLTADDRSSAARTFPKCRCRWGRNPSRRPVALT
jgi:hypothetical protein